MTTLASFLSRHTAGPAGALLLASLGLALPAAAQTTPAAPPAAAVPQAAPSGPWSLQQAVDYALKNNLQVRQSQLTSELSDATLRQSRAGLLPTANANASQNWNFGTSIDPLTNEFKTSTIRSNNFSLSGQVNLFSGFQVRNTIKRDALDYQASLNDIEKARNDLSLNVASAYLQVLLADELLRTNQLRVNSTQQQVERTQKLLRAGSVAESNLLDSQAQLASDELNVVTAQNQRNLALLQLAQLLNLDAAGSSNVAIVTPQLPDPDEVPLENDLNGIYETAQGRLPEIKAADLRVQSSMRGVEVARGAYYPRLSFGAGIFTGYSSARSSFIPTGEVDFSYAPVFIYNPAAPTTPPIPTQYVTGVAQPRFETKPTAFSNQLGDNLGKQLQFNLNIPILNGFQARTNVQRSEINVKRAELNREQARLTLRQSIQQAYADALAAQRRYASSKRQVEALATAQRNAEIRFNNGLMNGTDYNIAKNNLNAAESTMIQAKYEYLFRSKVLDFYQGKPLAL
ncbi:TolC family protein [Hymenobacter busanensis]|uniref:TolC family protein n=1 Tax=Hymenobacter busanensis TaxID=2607656 RepID=A0A7L4ZSM8_9BACT|nr:TolC family protein [Hymenobacter busanensis]KAA9325826.1 TolC family protein [Hymenobacter busanensis]QHJ06334.1 TolC family protein [Hymenobacter busanensis]